MQIQNAFPAQPLTRELEHRFLGRDGTTKTQAEPVLCEHTIRVLVNQRLEMEFVCLPQYLPELIVGHLVTEGYLHRAEDALRVCISPTGESASVTLKTLSEPGPMPNVSPAPWDADWVFALADRFAAGMPVHQLTCATHSCFLARETELLFQCEDIGRHNAIDKAVGYALMNGIDLRRSLLYSSGRMPADMAAKAIRAGIPLLASKGSPTASAIALARQHQLTLVCAARRDRMKLFSDPMKKETVDSPLPIC